MSETNAHTIAYVRKDMLPEAAPPIAEKGAVKWMRENLFSSPFNAILTLASLYVIYWTAAHLLPWASNSVWNARSLSECREIFAVLGAADGGGACWAVIHDRWLQLIYGFYPSDSYWRPNLAMVLFFVAIAPILFSDRLPRQMLILSVSFPFIMPWLLWGGAFWSPLLVMAGFGVGYLAYVLGSKINPLVGTVAAVVAAMFWFLVGVSAISESLHRLVANARMETVLAESQALPTELRPEIAALNAQRAELATRTTELQAIKQEALVQVTDATDIARGEAIAAYFAEEGVDPEIEENQPSRAQRERAQRIGRDVAAELARQPEYDALRQTVLEATRELTAIRNESKDLSARVNLLEDDVSRAERLARNIISLPDRIDRLALIRAEMEGVLETVRPDLRGLRSENALPNDVSSEERDAVRAYLRARSEAATLETTITSTYKNAGRIGLQPIESRQFGGFMLALIIGLSGIILSLPLGILLALGRQSDLFIINKVSVAFIEVIRGVPLIVWLFTAQLLLNYFLPPGTTFDLLLRVIIMVTLFAAAYIAEVVRGGLAALPKGQYEAADSLGLDYWKSMRLIILPQALKISIPGIVNTFIGLFKDTTLVVFIGLLDPIGLSNSIRSDTDWNGIYWELFIFIGLMFFVACYSMGRYSYYLEKKLQREHR